MVAAVAQAQGAANARMDDESLFVIVIIGEGPKKIV
jgi:hypothetical protein